MTSVLEGKTDTLVKLVLVGGPLVAVDPNRNMVYVSNARDNTVSVIDGKTNSYRLCRFRKTKSKQWQSKLQYTS